MGALIGLVVGVVATVLVGRYYYLRSVHKSLAVFQLFDSLVFSGIAPDVRANLNFRFEDKEVRELQQIALLVANNGEKAIANVLEPLTLDLPPDVEVLNASIVYRKPEELKAEIAVAASEGSVKILFQFPLLNQREFFVVKLLLSGGVSLKDTPLQLLADDLPRSISIGNLPPDSLREESSKIDWSLLMIGAGILSISCWVIYVLHLVWISSPHFFPFPWETYSFSALSILVVVPGVVLVLFFALLGLSVIVSSVLMRGLFSARRNKFPLPSNLRMAVFPYQLPHFRVANRTGLTSPAED